MLRTLIVDDEPDLRMLMRMVIEHANNGLRVAAEASNGPDAVEAWRRERPEVIVLDYRMPGMSGLDVAEQILAEQPDQRIILFSAYLDADTVERATELGVAACMPKSAYPQIPSALWQFAPPA